MNECDSADNIIKERTIVRVSFEELFIYNGGNKGVSDELHDSLRELQCTRLSDLVVECAHSKRTG